MIHSRLKKGFNAESVQEMNRALILRLLHRNKLCSRSELSKDSGLRQATITNIINEFISIGLVKEVGLIEGQKGRRSIGIALNDEKHDIIGLRLTRNYFTVCLLSIFGSKLKEVTEPLDIKKGTKFALKRIKSSIAQIISSSQSDRILGIGFAIPGPFIRTKGKIALMSGFPGWEKIQIEEDIRSTFDIPLYFEHDANAAVVAEWLLGPHKRETGTMVYIAAGQGIGSGIIVDGNIIRGSLGIAGEIGHMSINYEGPQCACGNRGCLEQYCSTIAILDKYRTERRSSQRRNEITIDTFSALLDAYKGNDMIARNVIDQACTYLGLGIVNIINVLNPNVIIIGDELAQIGSELLITIDKTVRKHVLPDLYQDIKFELCSFKTDPVLVGIGALVVEKTFQRPSLILSE